MFRVKFSSSPLSTYIFGKSLKACLHTQRGEQSGWNNAYCMSTLWQRARYRKLHCVHADRCYSHEITKNKEERLSEISSRMVQSLRRDWRADHSTEVPKAHTRTTHHDGAVHPIKPDPQKKEREVILFENSNFGEMLFFKGNSIKKNELDTRNEGWGDPQEQESRVGGVCGTLGKLFENSRRQWTSHENY